MIKVKEAVIVEGKYDKIKLSSIIDGLIIETHGFRIFSDKKQMEFIRRMADTRGILILTDSDSAGFLIRHYLSACIDPAKIRHAYIPDILGREKRKKGPSSEGKLGVEGIPKERLIEALRRAGVGESSPEPEQPPKRQVTKADLYADGLTGAQDSAQKRKLLLRALDLPEHLSTNALLQVLNGIMNFEEYRETVETLFQKTE
ncbi:MAG TPA: DUF4093 domain-containing protein [Ruminococcaceae bacterium]|nr:DUF4093 domain-containing protein [Oscillospiraceae bacterium]